MKKIMAICLMGVLAMASLTGCGGAGGKKDIKNPGCGVVQRCRRRGDIHEPGR